MPNIVMPKPEPAFPAYFNAFAPLTNSALANSCAPVIANASKVAEQNHVVALTGENNNVAYLWNQTTAGTGNWVTLTAVSASNENSVFNIPATFTMTPQSACMVWTATTAGGSLSAPVLMNGAQAWAVAQQGNAGGPVAAGDTIWLEGAGFNDITPLVAVYNGTTAYGVPATSWDPFSLQFQVPAGLGNGTWNVCVHNGVGGQFGWAGPLTITVGSASTWPGGVFDCVKTYGCKGDGVTDDTAAIKATVQAATAAQGQAYFEGSTTCASPCVGKYLFSAPISIPGNNAFITGDSSATTEFLAANNYSGQTLFGDTVGAPLPGPYSGITYSHFGVMANSVSSSAMVYNFVFQFNGNNTYTTFNDVSVSALTNQANGQVMGSIFDAGAEVTINDCNFYGYDIAQDFGNYVTVTNSNLYGRDDGGFGGGRNITGFYEKNCQEFNFDPSATSDSGFACGNGFDLAGGNNGVYEAGNSGLDLGTNPTYGLNTNAGQFLLFEASSSAFAQVTATSGSPTTVTIPGDAGSAYAPQGIQYNYVLVINGPGTGQWARITRDNAGVLSISDVDGDISQAVWNETPTSKSFVAVCELNENVALYDNTASGNGNINATNNGAEFYGQAVNSYINDNNFSGENVGVFLWSPVSSTTPALGATWFDYVIGNTLDDMTPTYAGPGMGILIALQFESAATKNGAYFGDLDVFDNTMDNPESCTTCDPATQGAAVSLSISDTGGLGSYAGPNMDGMLIQGNAGSVMPPAWSGTWTSSTETWSKGPPGAREP
jgi:hypothetical protein